MHTHISKHNYVFHFHSDFSDTIYIKHQHSKSGISIPAEDLLAFVAYYYIMPNKIEKIEEADWKELLK